MTNSTLEFSSSCCLMFSGSSSTSLLVSTSTTLNFASHVLPTWISVAGLVPIFERRSPKVMFTVEVAPLGRPRSFFSVFSIRWSEYQVFTGCQHLKIFKKGPKIAILLLLGKKKPHFQNTGNECAMRLYWNFWKKLDQFLFALYIFTLINNNKENIFLIIFILFFHIIIFCAEII